MRTLFGVALFFLCLLTASYVAAETFQKTIDVPAIAVSRQNVVVQFPLDIPVDKAKQLTLVDAKTGQVILAQLTHPSIAHPERKASSELVFILESIPANEPRSFRLSISDLPGLSVGDSKKSFHWTEQPAEYLELSDGDRPVLRYMMKPLDE